MTPLSTVELETLVANTIFPNTNGGITPALLAGVLDAFILSYPNLVDGGLVSTSVVYNITEPTIISSSPGSIVQVSVLVSGTGEGSVNDCTNTGAASVSNQLWVIPEIIGLYSVNWQCTSGICVIPGPGQTLAVSFSPTAGGATATNVYDITSATIVKSSAGTIVTVSVIQSGSTEGAIFDCASTSAASQSNQLYIIPDPIGLYSLGWQCATGICVVPGTGQILAVSFS